MKCIKCEQGTLAPGRASLTLTRGDTTLTFERVPAEICDHCGEKYFSATDLLVAEREANAAGAAHAPSGTREFVSLATV